MSDSIKERLSGSKTGSRISCCVVGCTNRYEKTVGRNIKYHRFPKRERKPIQWQAWVKAVRRMNTDGSQWTPTSNHRICSSHFVGGIPSNIPSHPGYAPQIFPDVYRSRSLGLKSLYRFERSRKRKQQQKFHKATFQQTTQGGSTETMSRFQEVGIQTEDSTALDPDELNILFCCRYEQINEVEVQTQIISTKETKRKTCDANVGPSNPLPLYHCKGFHGYDTVKNEKSAFSEICGVSSVVFSLLLSMLCTSASKLRDSQPTPENKLLLFLMKLKLALPFSALSRLFGCHRSTASRTFFDVLNCMRKNLNKCIFWPTKEDVKKTMPNTFKEKYPSCRIIIDCSEIRTETPSDVKRQCMMYSSYKSTFTVKFLLGCTPSGFISFLSKCYGGRSTDCFITVDSGILNLIEKGDQVLADKGFPTIESGILNNGAVLVMPPFGSARKSQFEPEEVDECYNVASLRVHVERCIQRVKMFEILSSKLPLDLLPVIDDIVFVCCALVNMQSPIIRINNI